MIHALDIDTVRIDNIHRTRDVCVVEPEYRVPPGGSKSLKLTAATEILLHRNHCLRIVPEPSDLPPRWDNNHPNDSYARKDTLPRPDSAVSRRDTLGELDIQSSMALLIRPLYCSIMLVTGFLRCGERQAQADHAARAIAAARQMLVVVDDLRVRWRDQLGIELDIGTGINSRLARVGNVGSRLKFKYGVLGNTVDIGSRLQGVCKQMGVQCIVSAATVESLSTRQNLRRLSTIRVGGIRQVLEVYQCVSNTTPEWLLLKNESALDDYKAGRPGESVHRLGRLVQNHKEDRPSAHLLVEAARALTDPSNQKDTIWNL